MNIKKQIRKLYDLGSRVEIIMERAIAGMYRKLKKRKKNKKKKKKCLKIIQ